MIVYSPLELLTGAFSHERVAQLDSDDWRRSDPAFTTHLDANLAMADTLGSIAERQNVPTPAVAVAWTLAWPGVTGAIVGARRPDQVDGWLPAANRTLSDGELDQVADTTTSNGIGNGPARP